MEANPTIHDVRNNFVAILYCIASTLDIQIREGAGAAMLGLPDGTPIYNWPNYADFDLSSFPLARDLEDVYSYAFHGELGRTGEYGISCC